MINPAAILTIPASDEDIRTVADCMFDRSDTPDFLAWNRIRTELFALRAVADAAANMLDGRPEREDFDRLADALNKARS